ncbi:GNAT family N-acetyltransferase [Pseudomonas tolaasii]
MKPWPELSQLPPDTLTPPIYQWERLAREDIAQVCAHFRRWYPDITVGSARYFCDEHFYATRVCLAGEDDRDVIVFIARHAGEMVAAVALEKNPDNNVLYNRVGACDPAHRGTGASGFMLYIMDALAVHMEFAMVWNIVTLKSRAAQRLIERADYEPVGIVPYSDRELNAGGAVTHVSEIIYVKLFKTPVPLSPISTENMTDKVRALWHSLEGQAARLGWLTGKPD